MRAESTRATLGLGRSGCLWGLTGGAIGIGVFLLVVMLGPILPLGTEAGSLEPVLTVVAPPTPTATPTLLPAAAATPSSEPSSVPSPGGPAGDVKVGDFVEIFGTEGEGLRLRSSPSLDAPVNVLGLEHEVLEVKDGPVEADGYEWWYLSNPYDTSKQGWAVAIFLRSIGTP